jgi:hypothetical protein
MNAYLVRRPNVAARLAGLALALGLSAALLSTIAHNLHIERFGQGAPLVELEAVVITPKPAHTATELARAEAAAARTRVSN